MQDQHPLDGRILVTGAGGFVGRHLMAELTRRASKDSWCLALSRNPSPVALESRDTWQESDCDLADAEQTEAAVKAARPDYVIHLAAQSSVGRSLGEGAAATWSANIQTTLNLANAVRKHAPNAVFLFASTCEIYGLAFKDGMVTETTPPQPQNPYARSKHACEQMLADALPPTSRLIVLRTTNHSGPGQSTSFVIPEFARQIAAIEAGQMDPVMSVGNLEAKRDFLHVSDVLSVMLDLLRQSKSLGPRSVFNVCSGKPISLQSVLDELLRQAGREIAVTIDPDRLRPGEISATHMSVSALTEAIGWHPDSDLPKIVADVLADQRRLLETQV